MFFSPHRELALDCVWYCFEVNGVCSFLPIENSHWTVFGMDPPGCQNCCILSPVLFMLRTFALPGSTGTLKMGCSTMCHGIVSVLDGRSERHRRSPTDPQTAKHDLPQL